MKYLMYLLRVFGNGVIRHIFGPKTKRLETINNSHSLPDFRMIVSRIMVLAGYVVRMGIDDKYVHNFGWKARRDYSEDRSKVTITLNGSYENKLDDVD